eukprot:FR740972.1.p1 GENE.FR740972.1~~FR740972.1.p1  ORF type:complete len:242 (+),score=38.83 FR740972.1:108-833(+)
MGPIWTQGPRPGGAHQPSLVGGAQEEVHKVLETHRAPPPHIKPPHQLHQFDIKNDVFPNIEIPHHFRDLQCFHKAHIPLVKGGKPLTKKIVVPCPTHQGNKAPLEQNCIAAKTWVGLVNDGQQVALCHCTKPRIANPHKPQSPFDFGKVNRPVAVSIKQRKGAFELLLRDSQGPKGSTISKAAAPGVKLQLLFPLGRVNCALGEIRAIAVSRVKLLSRPQSPQNTTPEQKRENPGVPKGVN